MKVEMEKIGIAYLRVSTKEQVENFSLDNQLELIQRKAIQEGYTLSKIFREEGESAKTTDRTELKDLIKYATSKKNNVKAIFIYKYDRLNRNQLDFLLLRKMFASHGISLFSATEISGETPEAQFVQSLMASFAEFENVMKGQRVQQGMQKRFESGYTFVKAHSGYKKTIIDGKTLEIPDSDRFLFLQSVWKKIAYDNWSLGKARIYLNESGLFNPFTKQSVSKLFSNTFYMGILQSKKYGQAKGRHQPMIDEEVFYRARATITGKLSRPIPKMLKLREELPLRSFLLCKYCQLSLTGAPSTSKTGAKIFYYNCNDRKHKYFGINAKKTNDKFLELLKIIKVKPGAMTYFEKLLREVYEEEYTDLSLSSKQIKGDVEIIEAALTKLKRKHLEGLYDDDEFKQMKEELKIELLAKQQLLGEKKVDSLNIETILTWNRYYLTHLDEVWLKASLEGKQAIASSIFPKKLLFDGKNFIEPQLSSAYKLNDMFNATHQYKYPWRDSNPQPTR